MSITANKRLTNELYNNLIPKYKNININYEMNKAIVTIKNVEIIISDYYPFRAPDVKINNLPYSYFIIPQNSAKINKIIHENNIFNNKCICCSSIIKNSVHLWAPKYGIIDIMAEIDKINIVKQKVKYIIAIDNIQKSISDRIKQSIPTDIELLILEYIIDVRN